MSLSIDPAAGRRPLRAPSYPRPIGLAALLAAEGLAFSLRFDGPAGLAPGSWWGLAASHPRFAIRAIVIAAAASAMFGGFRLAARLLRAFEADSRSGRPWAAWLLAHGAALAGFAGLSMVVCDGGVAATGRPGAWVAAWAACGLAAALAWLGALLSPGAWLAIARRAAGSLGMGAAVGIAAASAGYLTSLSWGPLARSTFGVARGLLGLVSADVRCDPSAFLLGESGFSVRIAPECSGFEGIGMTWAFLAAYCWWSRRSLRWPQAWLLFPAGTAAMWLANAARIAGLVLIGSRWSPSVALGGFHSVAGWLAFLAVGLGLVAASRRSSFFSAAVREGGMAGSANPTAAYLAPLLAIVATSMITGAFSAGFDAAYGLRALAGGWAIWHFRREFGGQAWSWSWGGVAIGVAAFAVWAALEPAPSGSAGALASGLAALPRGWAWAWVAARVAGSVLVVPVAEELAFRGYLARRLISADFESVPMGAFTWASFLASSAAFGLLHGRWLAGTLVGLMFALAARRRWRLGDAALAHAVANLLVAATVLAGGDSAMWA